MGRYRDRVDAGRQLAGHLAHHGGSRPLVVGLAGGGVVVADEAAAALAGTVDVVVVVPFGAPGSPELLLGAVGSDGVPVIEADLAARLGLGAADLAPGIAGGAAAARRRERSLRGERGFDAGGRTVIVVDDGVAGGVVLRAALGRLRRAGAAYLVCAVPVGPPATIDLVAAEADEVVCPLQPLRFHSVADWYDDFPEVGDAQVAALLAARFQS